MNSEISEIENDTKLSSDSEPETTRKGGSGLAFLALLLSLAAIAGTGWIWWQENAALDTTEQRAMAEVARLEAADSELALKLNQLRDTVETAAASDDGAEFAALNRQLAQESEKLARLESGLSDQVALGRSLQAAAEAMQGRLLAAEAALSGMSSRELDAGSELDLAEVDYLLRLANERLKLFADPVAADQALEVADMHLASIDNPIYLGVRRDIAAARRSLADVDVPNGLELANQLDALQQSIPALQFPGQEAPAAAAAEVADESWWSRVKAAFSGLVTVRRSAVPENERISIEDKDFIRQRVWLQLEIAHLAMMRRDQQAYEHALARVSETVAAWFDADDPATVQMLDGLAEMQAMQIEVDVPDITAPWTTLRAVRAGQPRPAPAQEVAEDAGGEGE